MDGDHFVNVSLLPRESVALHPDLLFGEGNPVCDLQKKREENRGEESREEEKIIQRHVRRLDEESRNRN